MARERESQGRIRRGRKVRAEMIVNHDTTTIAGDLLQRDDIPEHLQPIKEHYEESVFADEAQKRIRIKAQGTLGEMNTVSKQVLTTVNDNTTDAVNYLNEQPMRPEQRKKFVAAIDEVDDITIEAIQDGLEEAGRIVNDNSDTDPRTHRKARVARERKLSATERITGRTVGGT